jgi:hypothetical protein
MKIESSTLALQSTSRAYSRYEKTEQLEVGITRAGQSGNNRTEFKLTNTVIQETNSISSYEQFKKHDKNSQIKEAADQLARTINQPTQSQNGPSNVEDPESPFQLSWQDKLKILLLLELLGRFKQDPKLLKDLGLDDLNIENMLKQAQMMNPSGNNPGPAQAPPPRAEMTYTVHESVYQQETAQFAATGEIHTADGQTINISMSLSMSRESYESSDTSIRIASATKDPLVINFDGTAAQLSDTKFAFDLTADGKKELISQLTGNRAFLAIDKNQDGTINDGTELFGPKTGSGFNELAQYDDDKNGWIDEQDAAFTKLLLWMNPGSEQQKLVDLKTAGVGALYTGNAQTPFHLQNSQNSKLNLGVIQATGVFLKENGDAGTIQHVDLAV